MKFAIALLSVFFFSFCLSIAAIAQPDTFAVQPAAAPLGAAPALQGAS